MSSAWTSLPDSPTVQASLQAGDSAILQRRTAFPDGEPHPPAGVAPSRIAALDAARGIAILGMVGFHLTWDLAFAGFIGADAPALPAFKLYSHLVASAFLLLVGVSLVLADRRARNRVPFWRRIGVLAAASLGISVVTRLVFPDSFIFFGILHCIAAASILTLPLLRAPAWLVAAASLACLALPFLVAAPVFDAPAFWWTGLGTHVPVTEDYRPLFPWLGVVLGGTLLARAGLASDGRSSRRIVAWAPRHCIGRLLAAMGRHALVIYLAHQPLLFGAVLLAAHVAGTQPGSESAYMQTCRSQCVATGSDAQTCAGACSCLADDLHRSGLWERALQGSLQPDENARLARSAWTCLRRPAATPP